MRAGAGLTLSAHQMQRNLLQALLWAPWAHQAHRAAPHPVSWCTQAQPSQAQADCGPACRLDALPPSLKQFSPLPSRLSTREEADSQP